jgi:hypothetical protein
LLVDYSGKNTIFFRFTWKVEQFSATDQDVDAPEGTLLHLQLDELAAILF